MPRISKYVYPSLAPKRTQVLWLTCVGLDSRLSRSFALTSDYREFMESNITG